MTIDDGSARGASARPDPRRVRECFDEVVSASGDEVDQLLAARCGDDAALRREVESLLRAVEPARDVLGTGSAAQPRSPAASAEAAVEVLPRELGSARS